MAVPIVLNVLKDMSLEPDIQPEGLFDKALGIAVSIKDVASKLVCEGLLNHHLKCSFFDLLHVLIYFSCFTGEGRRHKCP